MEGFPNFKRFPFYFGRVQVQSRCANCLKFCRVYHTFFSLLDNEHIYGVEWFLENSLAINKNAWLHGYPTSGRTPSKLRIAHSSLCFSCRIVNLEHHYLVFLRLNTV